MRYKIAIGAAEALSFIHSDFSRPVIHRDVKSSNILLSNEFKPQVVPKIIQVFNSKLIVLYSKLIEFFLNFSCQISG